MHLLIYVGSAPARELVLQICQRLVPKLATRLTLVANGSHSRALLDDGLQRLAPPAQIEVRNLALDGTAQAAILAAARAGSFDLVVFGQLDPPIGRLVPGIQSKLVVERLEPSVLRVHGSARPIQRILVASGGDYHTYDAIRMAEQIALPLGAAITLLHVLSHRLPLDQLSDLDSEELRLVRAAGVQLNDHGVETHTKQRIGIVLDEILAELRIGSYDLLVVGAHRVASALDRILLEDITGDLLDVSPLPVLVVK